MSAFAAGSCQFGYDSCSGGIRALRRQGLEDDVANVVDINTTHATKLGWVAVSSSRDRKLMMIYQPPCNACPYGSIDDGVSSCCVPCTGGTYAYNVSQCISCGEWKLATAPILSPVVPQVTVVLLVLEHQ